MIRCVTGRTEQSDRLHPEAADARSEKEVRSITRGFSVKGAGRDAREPGQE